MDYIFINGVKTDLRATPVFMKAGTNVGPLARIFVNSSLHVQYRLNGNKITLFYNNNSLTIKDGSQAIISNGKKVFNALAVAPMKTALYEEAKFPRWVVPIKSVCNRLGLNYDVSSDGYIHISEPAGVKNNANQIPNNGSGKVVVVLDAGHGGVDCGAMENGLLEKNLNLSIVLAAKKYFDRDGRFKVLYTRTTDSYPTLVDRCRLANNNNADLFVCVHINSAASSSTGTETLYNVSRNAETTKNGITSADLAVAMQRTALSSTGFPNRGLVNRSDLLVLNGTKMPACLIEYGFVSNPIEAKQMHANTERYGKDLYVGIVQYMRSKGRIR
jgi:N-acetylmuramoyl-L-alanine amidase